ncbi:MAG: hypothetical protein KDK34_21260 [Leptospiraceae bacterium]|nr:hypothetical protein [Leptospiraceae bacterium]
MKWLMELDDMPQFLLKLIYALLTFAAILICLLWSGYTLINTDHYSIWLLNAASILLSVSFYKIRPIFTGAITASILCLVLYLAFLEKISWNTDGFLCDGPHTPQVYNGPLNSAQISDLLQYRSGYIGSGTISENPNAFISYSKDQQLKTSLWTYILEPSSESNFQVKKIEALQINSGILRDRLTFRYLGQHGYNTGYLHIWKLGQPHNYCLGFRDN